MKDMVTAQQCLEIIADLAELLPRILRPKLPAVPGLDLEDFDFYLGPQRTRWDPVFTGGGIVSLLITDPAAPPPSLTKDVDLVLEIHHWLEFVGMEGALRKAGFTQNNLNTGLIVAWDWKGVRVDFLPHQPVPQMEVTNRWFPILLQEAQRVEATRGKFVWIASAPCFLATKFEAFHSRGKGDYAASKDIEDILAVVDGRPELLSELQYADSNVIGFLSQCCRNLLNDSRFMESLPYLLAEQERESIALNRLKMIVEIN